MFLFVYHDVRDFLSCCFLVDTGGLFRAFFHATLRVPVMVPVANKVWGHLVPFDVQVMIVDGERPIEEVFFFF